MLLRTFIISESAKGRLIRMIKNKELIEGIIKDRQPFTYAIRNRSDHIKTFSTFKDYDTQTALNDFYNSPDIDGIKFKFKYTTLTINARNGY